MDSEQKPIFETPDVEVKKEGQFPNRKKIPGGVPRRTENKAFVVDKQKLIHPTEEEREGAEGLVQSLEEERRRILSALGALEIKELPGYSEGVSEFSEAASSYLEQYYGSLGVNDVPLPVQTIFVPDDLIEADLLQIPYFSSPTEEALDLKRKLLNPLIGGASGPNFTYVKIPRTGKEEPTQRAIWEIMTKETVAHEMYHSLAPMKLKLGRLNKNESRRTWGYSLARKGLAYYGHVKEGREPGDEVVEGGRYLLSALEEGLTSLFEYSFRDSLLDAYEIGPLYRKWVREVAERENIPEECLFITRAVLDPKNGRVEKMIGDRSWYPNSVRLVKFVREELEKRGHDFHVLTEEARLHNKTISLGKAVEAVFGKNTYRKLASASEDTARDLLQELRSVITDTTSQ